MRLLVGLLAAALAATGASCSINSSTNHASETPALLDTIPLPGTTRAAAIAQQVPGDSPFETSLTGTTPGAGQTLAIEPVGEPFAWAIYLAALVADHYPTGLALNTQDLTGEYWIGVADYDAGQWRWQGPLNTAGPVAIQPWSDGAACLNGTHSMAWAVVATQGSAVTIHQSNISADLYTWIDSPDCGDLLVRLTPPQSPRYVDGAPVVVQVNAWVMEPVGFTVPLQVQLTGAVQLSYLWPGTVDEPSGLSSDGVFDYGGEDCQKALRDVIRFAAGQLNDTQGRTIDAVLPLTVRVDNVGLNSFSHPGIMATNVLARYAADLPGGLWFVGGENPTNDQIITKEVGIWEQQQPRVNPTYSYPVDYSPTGLVLDYTAVGWIEDPHHVPGRPLFIHATLDDYIMHEVTPEMWGKRYFSSAMCQALLVNGVFTAQTWPVDVATLTEARDAWPLRSCVGADPVTSATWNHYADVPADLRVMLLFAVADHMQPHADKPHVHMAYDGFHHNAGCWTRLNPDRSYVQAQFPPYSGFSPDNPANAEPVDWLNAENWAHPNDLDAKEEVALAAVAEMADRTYYTVWTDNLPGVLP